MGDMSRSGEVGESDYDSDFPVKGTRAEGEKRKRLREERLSGVYTPPVGSRASQAVGVRSD